MNSKIAVLGCGWLGFPLAKTLVENGCQVHGSTTSESKLIPLQNLGIIPFMVQLTAEGVYGELKSCLSGCDTVIVNIPPGLRKNPEHNYIQKMTHLVDAISISSKRNVLFIGSTSVYDDEADFPIITEKSATSNDKKARQLLAVENLFLNNTNFRSTILRFSGLFAEDRHPATFLSGLKGLKNAEAPVNLIHRNDCIGIILNILQKNLWDMVFNASTTANPTKQAYYTSVCKTLQITVPEFDSSMESKGKIIDSTALKQILEYEFQVTIPFY